MLHEILLSLSGHKSPLLTKSQLNDGSKQSAVDFPLLSPPERALLTTVSDLTDLHIKLRQHLFTIASTHNSIICRAVSVKISSQNLRDFQKKILEVEKAVLEKDAAYVGGYGIVPLSTVVGEFAPWTRRLQWLWGVACFILPEDTPRGQPPRYRQGPELMDFLRKESYTGYTDLEVMALDLLEAAEFAWLKQISSWLLWGKLPSRFINDIFIHSRDLGNGKSEFFIQEGLLPSFISLETAESVLFIGNSINQIRSRGSSMTKLSGMAEDSISVLLPTHLNYLEGLKPPFSAPDLAQTIYAVRISLSRNALAQLLPVEKVIETIDLLQRFFLLEQGEFAVSLIGQADQRMHDRHRVGALQLPVRKAGHLDKLTINEGEVSGALNQTWAELASLQNDEDPVDEQLERAREFVRMTIVDPRKIGDGGTTTFDDLLFPTATRLSFSIEQPLDLFLSDTDVQRYSEISSYLLSIRRASLHLSSLWHNTSLRRCQPTPAGPPFSASSYGQSQLRERRNREKERDLKLRPFWAVATSTLFLITELGAHLQGSVIHNHCESFKSWLKGFQKPYAKASRSATPSRPSTATDSGFEDSQNAGSERRILDPSTLASNHRRFLDSLAQSLFLTSSDITQPLHQLLVSIEHFIAVLSRLSGIYAGLDLEAEGVDVGDPTRSYAQEEIEVLAELGRTREDMTSLMTEVAEAVKNWGESDLTAQHEHVVNTQGMLEQWHRDRDLAAASSGIEGLIMRMEFLGAREPATDEDVEMENEL